MEKLTLEHLAPYLPYGLTLKKISKGMFACDPNVEEIKVWSKNDIGAVFDKRYHVISCIPILRPLSDLTNEILDDLFGYEEGDICSYEIITTPSGEFGYIEYRLFGIGHISPCIAGYNELKILFKHHFDVFGLIDKGLAIDINTLTK